MSLRDPLPGAKCPHCGGQIPDYTPGASDKSESLGEKVQELRAWCSENGHPVLPVDRVQPDVAAAILGVSAGHLANSRSYGGLLMPTKVGGRVFYTLADIARKLLGQSS